MDIELNLELIERDWARLLAQSARLCLGTPVQAGTDVLIPVRPIGANQDHLAILECDDYDAVAPLLTFADAADPARRGAEHWPRMATAPMNAIDHGGQRLPIICTPGTRGYHLHPSHVQESHPRTTWQLPAVATLLARFVFQMGPYQGQGA